jgi:riboflavin synthase
METQTPDTEGVSPLPNQEVQIANYAILDVKRVVVYGTRGRVDGKPKYRPSVALFMTEIDQPHILIRVNLHETFDDAEVMARMGVIWANNMFQHVSKIVKIFDDETEELIVSINVPEVIAIEDAVEELRLINVTNKYKVH